MMRRWCRIRVVLVLLGTIVAASLSSCADAFVTPTTSRTDHNREPCISCAAKPRTSSSSGGSSSGSNNNISAKPAFSQAAHVSPAGSTATKRNTGTIIPNKPVRRFNSDSTLGSIHEQRIKTAGRVGTKRYVNPCKVFVGNLPFSVTSGDLLRWICEQQGLPSAILANECKIIEEWKTGKSKGYGFIVFTEPIYATVCMDKCNGLMWDGRVITVNQGVKKEQEQQLWLKKKKKKPEDQEEEAIVAGLEEAEEPMDPEEVAILRMLDPDLLPQRLKSNAETVVDDSVTLPDENGEPMNRERRRDAERKQKRLKKATSKGFGSNLAR